MINMPVERFIQTSTFIKYDGTNWTSEIEPHLVVGAIVTDLGDGAKHIEDGIHDPQDIYVGDYMGYPGGSFIPATLLAEHYVSTYLGLPG